ncbi:MAG: hypothetical protein WA906_13330 [Pacificimonas sp.]
MLKTLIMAATVAALPGAAVAQSEAAGRSCVSPEESRAVVANLLPDILKQSAISCRAQIGEDNWLTRDGASFAMDLEPLADRAWPDAKRALERIAGNPLPDDPAMLAIGRSVIAAGIATNLDAGACDTVSRLTAELAPLPPANFAGVFALFLELGIAENADVPFRVCRAES